MSAGEVKGLAAVTEVGEEGVFGSLGEAGLQGFFCFCSGDAVHGEGGSVVVEGALEDFPCIFASTVEVVVTQDEFGCRVCGGTYPVADGFGVVQDVLEAGVPGRVSLTGVEEFFDFVECGGFDSVADAADFPDSAFVGGGESGDAEGGGAGDAVIFKFEDGGGHFLFGAVH